MSNALITFVKNPEKGKVKTRLAKTVGDDKALAIYKALLEHTRNITSSINCNRLLFYSQTITISDNWSPQFFQKFLQIKGDLGVKMSNAFEIAFQTNEKVIIIGSDCASLTSEIIQSGFEQLNNHDFVIGPAIDGGYYLLGMRKFQPEVFQDIPWSTEQVARLTKTRIKSLNASYHLLPTLSDIDYEEDWIKYGWEL